MRALEAIDDKSIFNELSRSFSSLRAHTTGRNRDEVEHDLVGALLETFGAVLKSDAVYSQVFAFLNRELCLYEDEDERQELHWYWEGRLADVARSSNHGGVSQKFDGNYSQQGLAVHTYCLRT